MRNRLRPAAGGTPPAIYRAVVRLISPIVHRWGRLTVTGLEHLPVDGPVLLIANHDSHWDPVVIAAAVGRRRYIRAMAKHTLWRARPLAVVLDGMGQIPVHRGAGDAGALDTAVRVLKAGGCVGIFPEGTLSHGQPVRARSGAARLAQAVPEAVVVGLRLTGAVDMVRFPRRPRLRVELFRVRDDGARDGDLAQLAAGWMAEVRAGAPFVATGRRR